MNDDRLAALPKETRETLRWHLAWGWGGDRFREGIRQTAVGYQSVVAGDEEILRAYEENDKPPATAEIAQGWEAHRAEVEARLVSERAILEAYRYAASLVDSQS